MTLTRRDFLTRSAAAAMAAAAVAPRAAFAQTAQRIVVIGAGLAGLCAAFELIEAGHDVDDLSRRGLDLAAASSRCASRLPTDCPPKRGR